MGRIYRMGSPIEQNVQYDIRVNEYLHKYFSRT